MPSLTHLVASAVIGAWLSMSSHSWRRLPRPRGEPLVHAPGPDPDRILVVGSGAVVGYGVLWYDLSVSGQLARLVAGETGRGVDLRVVAHPDLDVTSARHELGALSLRSFDVIVITLGSLDALELLPRRIWGEQLDLLLEALHIGPGQRVLLMGIPQLTELVSLPRPYRGAVARRVSQLNAESALRAGTRAGVTFVPFAPPPLDLLQNASREVHTVWARIIAPSVVAAVAR